MDIDKIEVLDKISPYIDLKFFPFGEKENVVCEVVKREAMYGGNGTVYMVSVINSDILVNNRFAQYMILLNKGDEGGFHEHGSRKEQELYVVVHGEGKYIERKGDQKIIRETKIKKGNISSIQGTENYHAIINTSEEPLIIFVIATNEK